MASDTVLTCSNCAATIDEADADEAGWRYRSDGVGELHVFCDKCERREFSPDASASSPPPAAADRPTSVPAPVSRSLTLADEPTDD